MTDHTHASPAAHGAQAPSAEYTAARVKALESLLIEKGMLTEEAVDRIAERYEHEVGPHRGAEVVARAWTEPAFKERLLEDATAACADLDMGGAQGEHMVVVENTPSVHNVVVCTLCSCYPWPALGLPPNWYKEPAYRAQIVRDPRRVLREEFGLDVPASKEIRVWDSSAEIRYWVLPERPDDTDALSPEELASLVTRDAMIGVGVAAAPAGS